MGLAGPCDLLSGFHLWRYNGYSDRCDMWLTCCLHEKVMALVCHQGLRQVPVKIKWVQSVTPWVILGMTALVYMLEQ